MKKGIYLILLSFCCASVSFAQAPGITIKGGIKGFESGRLYLLAQSSEENTDTLGCCEIYNGRFELKAPVAEPLAAQLVVGGYSGGFTLFAEPGAAYEAYLSEDDSYYIRGGELNDSYVAHMRVSDSLRVVIAGLQERYDAFRAERKFRIASLVNDSLRREQENLRAKTQEFLDSNDNVISAYTVYSNIIMRDMKLRETKSMYASLGEGAKSSLFGRIIKERIDRLQKTEGGAPAPDFTLPDLSGNPVTMSAVKGKIKIIDFWASWCGPCRLNNPQLKKLYDEYHERGLEIIGVSLDTEKEDWEMAVEKDGLNWIQVSSLQGWDCEIAYLYDITGVPALFILDENNRIVATGLRDEQLKAFLEEALK